MLLKRLTEDVYNLLLTSQHQCQLLPCAVVCNAMNATFRPFKSLYPSVNSTLDLRGRLANVYNDSQN